MPFSLQGFLDGHNVPVKFVTFSKFEAGREWGWNGGTMRKGYSHLHMGPQVLCGSGFMPPTLSCSYGTFTGVSSGDSHFTDEDGEAQRE